LYADVYFFLFFYRQLQAALLDIHDIFFEIPVHERMALIRHSRHLMEEKQLRGSVRITTGQGTTYAEIISNLIQQKNPSFSHPAIYFLKLSNVSLFYQHHC
jgi:hypothetical protein